jgi:uncharacterized protein
MIEGAITMPTTISSTQKLAGLLLAASALFTVLPDVAKAASFDCRQASIAAERTICRNANLSQLDARTAGMYFTILGNNYPASTLAQVKNAQRRFLATRNACGYNVNCLVDAYTSQMMYLKNVANP